MVELLLKLEMSLWIESTRNSNKYMESILHESFYEIGQSGKKWTKSDILAEKPLSLETRFPLTELSIKELHDDSYLISYKVEYTVNDLVRKSYRSSIWLKQEDSYQLLFHQGTAIS